MSSDTATIVKALRILSREIYCEDGVATAVIAEAADVIERLSEAIRRLAEQERHCPVPENGEKQDTTPHPQPTPGECTWRV